MISQDGKNTYAIFYPNFAKVIDRAKLACNEIQDHFPEVRKTIQMPKNAQKVVIDYELLRYACYLKVLNKLKKNN